MVVISVVLPARPFGKMRALLPGDSCKHGRRSSYAKVLFNNLLQIVKLLTNWSGRRQLTGEKGWAATTKGGSDPALLSCRQ